MDKWMDKQIDGWTNELINDGQMDGYLNGSMITLKDKLATTMSLLGVMIGTFSKIIVSSLSNINPTPS